ncbi:recombinase [Cytobacillus firmus]|uniref:tyrosine-type recombinase/integrase n=1 Tax=Cytobacillus firmus TaxID=1399 RepID=UPI00077CC015|nr:tyrosine-type recombinase/integrase [Cytobacillus firmus]MBG9541802.1 recombinase [Cytobacillus firmus]MBG9554991.1 recombinase [Cytobacillus firmus]MBG9558172.1 recombinase [Cytobacillus firmus]MBG9575560.1 recombinase [Cytobacillus firmus]MEC1894396.1 tyrosine-type recombinase/integrase [Cytobacillus firmus]
MLWNEGKKQFLNYLSSIERSQETIIGYGKDLKMLGEFLANSYNGEVFVEDVTTDDIENYLVWLKEVRNYQPKSRQRHLHTFRSFFSHAYKKEWVERDVALAVENIKAPQKERTFMEKEEVEELIEAIEHPLIQTVCTTLYLTGLRISECLNLTVDNVNLRKREILIIAGKGNKDRRIPISERLFPVLDEYLKYKRVNTSSQKFFATKKTGMLSAQYVNRVLSDTTKKLGWKKKVTAHIFRHTFASQLVKKEVNLVQIQKLLGHSSLKVTSVYTHTNMEQMAEAVNAL